MIQVNDLRIGNWLRYNDLFIQVNKIGTLSFSCTHRNLIFFVAEDCYPIPLSPEILKQMGFVMDYDGIFYLTIERKCIMITVHDGIDITFQSDIGIQAMNLNSDIENVHELQNLIYSLIGTEIKIEL